MWRSTTTNLDRLPVPSQRSSKLFITVLHSPGSALLAIWSQPPMNIYSWVSHYNDWEVFHWWNTDILHVNSNSLSLTGWVLMAFARKMRWTPDKSIQVEGRRSMSKDHSKHYVIFFVTKQFLAFEIYICRTGNAFKPQWTKPELSKWYVKYWIAYFCRDVIWCHADDFHAPSRAASKAVTMQTNKGRNHQMPGWGVLVQAWNEWCEQCVTWATEQKTKISNRVISSAWVILVCTSASEQTAPTCLAYTNRLNGLFKQRQYGRAGGTHQFSAALTDASMGRTWPCPTTCPRT